MTDAALPVGRDSARHETLAERVAAKSRWTVRTQRVVVVLAIVLSLYPQRLVVPGTVISIAFPILFLLCGLVLALRVGQISVTRMVAGSVLVAVAGIAAMASALWSPFQSGVESFLLLVLAWASVAVVAKVPATSERVNWNLLFVYCTIPAAVGILLQFVLQFAGAGFVDPVQLLSPTFRYTELQYSITYEFVYGSGLYKPNGFFFLEPSMASQYMGLAAVAALATKPRWAPLFILALLSTASGTGLLAFAVAVPFVLVAASWRVRIALVSLIVAVLALANATGLGELLTARSNEFFIDGTSGSARFVDPITVVVNAVREFPLSVLTGLGPGVGDDVAGTLGPVNANLSLGPKAFLEYGFIFTALIVVAVAIVIMRSRALPLGGRALMLAMILVLSGALIQGPTSLLLWSIVFASPVAVGSNALARRPELAATAPLDDAVEPPRLRRQPERIA
jgi:hypothetical protein